MTAIRFEAGGDHGVRLERLLIEARPLAASRPEAVAADRREVPALRGLRLEQPAQRGKPDLEHLAVARSSGRSGSARARASRCRRSRCARTSASPATEFARNRADELSGEHIAHLAHRAVAGEGAEIFVDREQREGPGARRTEARDRRQPALEKQRAEIAMALILRPAERRADRPERARVAVLRAVPARSIRGGGS